MAKMYTLIDELREPSVIYEEDPEDPKNPEVLVKGVGRYKLNTLKKNVRGKLEDLAQTDDWEQVAWKVKHAAMHEMIKTIAAAEKELQDGTT